MNIRLICQKCKRSGFTYQESPCSDEPDLAVWYAECSNCDHVASGCATEEDAMKEFNGSSVHICQHKFDEDGKMVYPALAVPLKILNENYDRFVGMIGDEHGFFRCGWCGQPTDPKGVVLELDLIPGGSDEDWGNAEQVNGECCPYGDEECQGNMLRDMGLM